MWPSTDLPTPSAPLPLDKLVHAGMFLCFGALWMGALRGPPRTRTGRVVILGLLFAAATEVGQGLLPTGRTPSVLDAGADMLGLLLGIGLFFGKARFAHAERSRPSQKAEHY